MSKGLGALVFIAGVAGLSYWGAKVQAVTMQDKVTAASEAVVADSVHPLAVAVSGRDITVSGIADTKEEYDAIVAGLENVRGRRVVHADAVEVLPAVDPYETAIAKGADGSYAMTGYVPSEAARGLLAEAGLPVDALPLAHGAPAGWTEALVAGGQALAPLDEGSFGLTDDTLTLSGIAATPAEDEAARAALDVAGDFESVVAVDVTDPGIVDFTLRGDAGEGFTLDGIVPAALGAEGIAQALGQAVTMGEVSTTFADLPGLETALAGLVPAFGQLETLTLNGSNAGLSVAAEALAGLSPEAVTSRLQAVLGEGVALDVQATATPPEVGVQRRNAVTGITQMAYDGGWLTLPQFEPTKTACTEAAMARVTQTPILFVSGSADLAPQSLSVINDLAGIVTLCTRDPGMIVTVGGHTDAQGDDEANYILSAQRARAVRDAFAARGVPAGRIIAIGYGETEPIADNETEEGRAQNRRITFDWPN